LAKAAVLQQTTGTGGGNRILDQLANKKTTGLSDAELVSLDAGEFLFREGDAADALYIVQKGTLRVVSGSTVYETLKPGGIVGEMALVDQSSRRSASVIAGTRAELLKIDRKQFLDLVATNPGFSIEVMQVMARRLRVMNRRYSNRS
jgi:CRP/FNR family cyclic AMP-dependent transcriptional regulator